MSLKVLFLQTEGSSFYSHRLPMALAAKAAGYEVVVAAREGSHGDLIRAAGLRLVPLPWRRSSVNPFYELSMIARIVRLYSVERPDLVHHVSAKPILYGSLAAAICGVPAVVNALIGLGFVFISTSLKARVLRGVVCVALRAALSLRNSVTIFQNEDDRKLFIEGGIVEAERTVLIRGSGVDIGHFSPSPEPEGEPLVVLPGRILWDKGVGEFVEAARLLSSEGVRARFALVGDRDEENPAAVPAARLAEWSKEGIVECWGHRSDMAEVYAQASVVVLPSYREGLPKALMEAAACARPLVAADVPGCREVVRHEESGLLVPVRNGKALAAALRILIEDGSLRRSMGERARSLAVAEFAQEKVVEQTSRVYRDLLGRVKIGH
ncbi:MAG: glycosyltransferase family 1 protein [Elusimicrobia bacterium CG11_big_fil_rev_8_21_14_0_20_64_6]|nr:MAG: glycosyltransferase family 1 protein [Elusimicrobia bacterium CG11_big_fil_rev_8_21_14_0_20_64_6]